MIYGRNTVAYPGDHWKLWICATKANGHFLVATGGLVWSLTRAEGCQQKCVNKKDMEPENGLFELKIHLPNFCCGYMLVLVSQENSWREISIVFNCS